MRKLKNNELGRINVESFKIAKKTSLVVVLDNVRSAINVGSVFRTADAFLLEKIVLCGITATPPNKEIQKAALGSTSSVNWEKSSNTIDAIKKLKKEGYFIIGIEQTENSTSLEKFKLSKKPIAVIFGHEIDGISQEVINNCDQILEIPQFGTKHSLNIAVCAGIIIWEIWKQTKD